MTVILTSEADVTDAILKAAAETVDWFEGSRYIPREDFIDRLCKTYGDGWDIESYDNDAVRKLMRHARKIRRERAQ